jgi:hypothetical protein
VVVAGVAAFLGASQARAQDIASVPRGALFGSSEVSSSRSMLDLTAAVSQAFDTEVPEELRSRVSQGERQSGGYSSMLIANANYARKRLRFDVDGSAATSVRYFQRVDQVSVIGSNAAVGAIYRFERRATLEVNQAASYAPSYLYRLFPAVAAPGVGESVPASPDYRIDEARSYSFDTTVKVDAGSPRHNRVQLSAERSSATFDGDTKRPDLDILSGRGTWAHGIARTGAVSVEYEYRKGEFGFGSRATEQRLRIGGEFTPALSLTRRASFRFTIAPSAMEIPKSANVIASGTLYKLEASASAQYPFLRSWSVGSTYRRGVEYIAVLREPVFRDAVRLEVSGLLGERIDVTASAGSSVGQSALARSGQRFDTYTGTTRVRYALARSFALYGEYLYYFYDFGSAATLAPDLPNRFEQHGVRVGLMLWARPTGR